MFATISLQTLFPRPHFIFLCTLALHSLSGFLREAVFMQILPAVSCLVRLLGKPAVQLSSLLPPFSSVPFTSLSSPLEVVFLEVAHASLLAYTWGGCFGASGIGKTSVGVMPGMFEAVILLLTHGSGGLGS